MSEVIHSLALHLGMLSDDVELSTTWAQLGCAHEWAMIQRYDAHFKGRYIQPGEIQRDGIYGTPDLLDLEPWRDLHPDTGEVVIPDHPFVPEEIKNSYMSSRHTPYRCYGCVKKGQEPEPECNKLWRYIVQLKSYCAMLSTPQQRITTGKLNVTHAVGDWRGKPPKSPQRVFRWTEREIEDNWTVILRHDEWMKKQEG